MSRGEALHLFLWENLFSERKIQKELFNLKHRSWLWTSLTWVPQDWAKEAGETDLNLDLICHLAMYLFSSVQSLSHVWLFVTAWTTARQASLSITNSWSPPKPMSVESMMPSNYLILCCPLLLLPSIFPSIRVFPNESALHIRWPKYRSFSFNISPSMNIQGWSPLGRTGWVSLQSKGLCT